MADTRARPVLTPVKEPKPDLGMRNLRSPVQMTLNISFHSSEPDAAKTPASVLPEESVKRLRALEPQLMKWLEDDHNKPLFLSDPVGALQRVDKDFDNTILKQLRRARQRSAPDRAIDSRVRLSEVHVAVVGKPIPRPTPIKAEPKPANK
jgi:hypothetical protein